MIPLSPYCDGTAGIFSISRPRQNVRHFSDDNFKCTFLNENVWISTEISLKSVTTGPIHNIPALVQIMAWRRPAFIWTNHSVESPSTVDPQWDIWYWGSNWNLHTVCWSAVGCEWGTTSVYFGITYVCFIPSRLPVFAVEPQYLLQDFLFLSKVSFGGHIQNLQKISCWFKIWMGFVGPKLIKLWTSSIWGYL